MHSVKWKYDYLLLKRIIISDVTIPFKRISTNAKVLLKAFPTSARYDFFAAENYCSTVEGVDKN